ncbi:MAG TPA: OmpH family outer membrane protein [Candidatus Nitrosotenuis sp.]|jgi:Skp family chaperone for outer membrane proteins|nr:OmpH family outer membrane protein [Candidatus Nitrosotenuis sp.]
MTKATRWALVVLGLAVAVLLGACQASSPRLKVAVVDTSRIVAELPEYRDLNLSFLKDTGSFYLELPRGRSMSEEERTRLRALANEKSAKWEKLIRQFMEKAHAQILTATAEVAREKGIDMVLVDTNYVRGVQYSAGENITTDVILHLRSR